ncbi:MAG TPA: hypothetical protein VGO61_17270 [Steroidobacteraceae bacterium]|nr:hypothetical protein [Steroidobacteraceae bacterium]
MPSAWSAEPASGIQAELVGMFKSYMKDLRHPKAKPVFEPCDEDLHCLAQYFSRRYLARFAQHVSEAIVEGRTLANFSDPLGFGSSIAKVHEYAAATTDPKRAVLTMIATDTSGNCMPLIRVKYFEEFGVWRIDRIEQDSSSPQHCDAAQVVGTF